MGGDALKTRNGSPVSGVETCHSFIEGGWLSYVASICCELKEIAQNTVKLVSRHQPGACSVTGQVQMGGD